MTSGQHYRNLRWQDVTVMGQFSRSSLVTLVLPVRSMNPVLPLLRTSSELVCNEVKEHPAYTLKIYLDFVIQ